MFTEKHILQNPYNNHKLSRTVSGYEVTTVDCSADKSSGWNGTTVNLTPKTVGVTQRFSGWSATGATIENSAFNLTADTTAKANFETAKSLTRQTDGHGTLASTKNVGFINEIANLYPTPNQGYAFSGYTITGATLTGSAFTFTGSNVTAKAWFSADPYNPYGLPSNTIRIKYNNLLSPTGSKIDSYTYVSSDSTSKTFDVYRASNDWKEFMYGDKNLYEVMGANTQNVTSLYYGFRNCYNLTKVGLSNVSSNKSFYMTFAGCSSLTSIPAYNSQNVSGMYRMCYNCSALKSVPLIQTNSVVDSRGAFQGCVNVTGGAYSLYQQISTQTTPPTAYSAMFRGCGSATTQGATDLNKIPTAWK